MDDVEIEVLDEACVVREKQNSLESDGAKANQHKRLVIESLN